MAEEVKRDSTSEPQQGQEAVTQEVLKDDQDPKEVLKAMLQQLGVSPEEYEVLSRKELQSLLDKKITEAIKTREQNLRKQQEEEKLKQEKQFEELLKMKERELLELKKQLLIRESGLPPELSELIDGSNEEEIKTKIEKAMATYQKLVEERLKQELEQRLKGKTPAQSKENNLKITRETLKNLTPQQINELFEKGEIQKLLKL